MAHTLRTRLLILLACLCLTLALRSSEAQAQAYSSQLTFLENFAVKLYERGDVDQATKEFQRILRIDPQSATAQKYLAEIAKGAAPAPGASRTPLDKANRIASDIQSIRKDISRYERDLTTLESLIRNLITENDQLYMSLNKRSREVMELREKAYGIRYSDQYKDVMAELPPDRVPQNLHRSDDILPQLPTDNTKADIAAVADRFSQESDELSALSADIAKNEKDIQDLTAKGTAGKNAEEFQRLLAEKRSDLVDKNLALIEKKDRLSSLKTELVSINTDLKTANNRYIELIDKIDKYYLSIKAELSAKNFVDQKMFSDLVYDYARKTKELETLRQSPPPKVAETPHPSAPAATTAALPAAAANVPAVTATTPKAVPTAATNVSAATAEAAAADQKRFSELMTNYEAQTKELGELKRSIAQREEKLTDYKAPLASAEEKIKGLDQSLAEKDKELAGLRAQIAYTSQAIAVVDSQVKNIQTLLKESDGDMAGLSDGISKIKLLIQDQKALSQKKTRTIETLTTTSGDNLAMAKTLEQDMATLKSSLEEKDRAIDAIKKKLTDSEKKATDLEIELGAKEENILTLEERLSIKDDEARKLHEASEAQPKASLPAAAAPAAPSSSEREQLRAAITQRDQKITELTSRLETKGAEILELNKALEESRKILNEESTAKKSKAELAAKLSTLLEEQRTEFNRTATYTQKEILQTRSDLQTRALDIKERELTLEQMKGSLDQRAAALLEAENQIKILEEKLAALENKQKAIRSVVDKRDAELAKLTYDLNASKDALRASQKELTALTARNKEAETALALAQKNLKESESRKADTEKQLEQLRKDLKTAQQVIKSRDKDLEALARLKDELEKRDKIIADLQERLGRK